MPVLRTYRRHLFLALTLVNAALLVALLATRPGAAQPDDTSRLDRYLERGDEAFYGGRYGTAARYLKRCIGELEENPDLVDAGERGRIIALTASAYRYDGEYDDALELLNAWFDPDKELDAGTREIGIALAWLHYYLGRFDAQEPVLAALARDFPEDFEVLALVGRRAYETGQDEVAREAFRAAINSAGNLRRSGLPPRQLSRAWQAVGECYYFIDLLRRTPQLNNALQCMNNAKQADALNYDAQVWGARISLEGNQQANARVTWLDPVLAQNPNHVGARCMYAETWYFQWSSVQGAAEAWTAYKIAPNSIEALLAMVQARINEQRYQPAWEFLNAALELNPRNLHALTMKGLLHLYSGEPQGFAETEEQILALCPGYSEFYRDVALGLNEQHRFAEAIEMGKKGLALDEADWQIHKAMGFAYARLGQNAKATEFLTEANRQDPYRNNLFTLNMLQVLRVIDEQFSSYETPDGRFIIRTSSGEARALIPLLERELNAAWDALTTKYGYEPEVPILFECFHRQDDFASRSIALPGIPALGVCFGQLVTMLSPSLVQNEDNPVIFSWAKTLRHEMDHVFQIQLSGGRVPRWLAEGCSVYEERRARPEWDREMDEMLIRFWHQDRLFRLSDINNAFRNRGTILFAYYLSSYMVEWIDTELGGYDKVVDMLRDFGEDRYLEEIIRDRLGMTLEEFDAGFRDYVKRHFIDTTQLMPVYGPADLARFKIEYEDNPEDPDLRARLGAAYLHNGNALDARLHTGVALRLDPGNRIAILTMGRILFEKGLAEESNEILQEGRDYYERALQLGVEDFWLFLHMGQLYLHEGDTEMGIEFLKMAKEAFPRYVGENNPYRLLSDLYAQRGENEKAIAELEQLAGIVELDFQTRQQLVQYHQGQGNVRKALQYMQEMENIGPLVPQLQQTLAGLLQRTGQWEDAAFAWKTLLGMGAGNPRQLRLNMINALYRAAKYDEAMDATTWLLNDNPNDAEAREWSETITGTVNGDIIPPDPMDGVDVSGPGPDQPDTEPGLGPDSQDEDEEF